MWHISFQGLKVLFNLLLTVAWAKPNLIQPVNLPAGRFRQESLDKRIHFYSSAFVHSLQDFDSVVFGWAWKAFLSSYIFLGRQCTWGQLEKKCGHQILWTCSVDSLFLSWNTRRHEVTFWQEKKWNEVLRKTENVSLSRCREGRCKYLSAVEHWFTRFELHFCIFHKSLVFGGTECFQGP